jgi:hypothetical protein
MSNTHTAPAPWSVLVGIYSNPRIRTRSSRVGFLQELRFDLEVVTDYSGDGNARRRLLVACPDAESIQVALSPPLSNWRPACRLLVSVVSRLSEDGVIRGTGLRALSRPSFPMPGIPCD